MQQRQTFRLNNVHKMEERITKAFEATNKLGETVCLSITNVYLRQRLDEIRLINEYEAKKYQEKQEYRASRASPGCGESSTRNRTCATGSGDRGSPIPKIARKGATGG